MQPSILEIHIVPKMDHPARLSDISAGMFEMLPSRKSMKKAIDKGLVRVNDRVAATGDWIKGGEKITLQQHPIISRPNVDLVLEVLFEDDFLAVVHKSAGIEVSGNHRRILENALPQNLRPSQESDALRYPQAIHRLDYPTSGALLIGKTRNIVAALNHLFADRKIVKHYFAVTIGDIAEQGEIEFPVEGKTAHSSYRKLQEVASPRFGKLNLVKLEAHTGRRHQLRKHLAALGSPILGDHQYGTEGLKLSGKGLYLHAQSLQFRHPVTEEMMVVEAPVPKKYRKLFPAGSFHY